MSSILNTPIEQDQIARRQFPAWYSFLNTHLPRLLEKREFINGDRGNIIMYRVHYLRAIVGRLTTLKNNKVIEISESMEKYIEHQNLTDAVKAIEEAEVSQAIEIAEIVTTELKRIMQAANKTSLH